MPEQVDQVASPYIALVVGRGKINQEINYYNAKIGSVAPNIENKMKVIFFKLKVIGLRHERYIITTPILFLQKNKYIF